jgi:hypothetical protein
MQNSNQVILIVILQTYKKFFFHNLIQLQKATTSSNLNPFPILPPISSQLSPRAQQNQTPNLNSIDHIITEPPNFFQNPPPAEKPDLYGNLNLIQNNNSADNYLPVDPIYLSPPEENALTTDVARELANYSSNQLKNFYSDMTSYDPNLTGYTHYHYVQMNALKNNVKF